MSLALIPHNPRRLVDYHAIALFTAIIGVGGGGSGYSSGRCSSGGGKGGEGAETVALAGEEAVATAAAVAELAVDGNMARWQNGPVCMRAPAQESQSSLANEGFFFNWILRREGAEKFTSLPPCV